MEQDKTMLYTYRLKITEFHWLNNYWPLVFSYICRSKHILKPHRLNETNKV